MNAHGHQFTTDATLDLALDILARGPRLAVDSCMAREREADWLDAAQRAVDGDFADLHDLEEEWAEAERAQTFVWEPDWRDSCWADDRGMGQ